jgi:hypothetical protein
MKVTYKEASKPPFSDLNPGDCFLCPDGDLLMKIDKIIYYIHGAQRAKAYGPFAYNAIYLITGKHCFFGEGIEVQPVKTEVIVEK